MHMREKEKLNKLWKASGHASVLVHWMLKNCWTGIVIILVHAWSEHTQFNSQMLHPSNMHLAS